MSPSNVAGEAGQQVPQEEALELALVEGSAGPRMDARVVGRSHGRLQPPGCVERQAPRGPQEIDPVQRGVQLPRHGHLEASGFGQSGGVVIHGIDVVAGGDARAALRDVARPQPGAGVGPFGVERLGPHRQAGAQAEHACSEEAQQGARIEWAADGPSAAILAPQDRSIRTRSS